MNAFTECPIKTFSVPNNLKRIGERAFYSCEELTNIEIQKDSNLQTIEERAFAFTKINKIYQAEIAQMKPAFLKIRNQLVSLGNDANLLRGQYKDAYKIYSDSYEKNRYQKNMIISTTKNQFKEKTIQINDLLKSENSPG